MATRKTDRSPRSKVVFRKSKIENHLSRRDPVLKRLIGEVGPFTLKPFPDRFGTLVRSIISQQISGKAAVSISTRLRQALPGGEIAPAAILAATEEVLRAAGLSAPKLRSLRDLSEKVHGGTVELDRIHTLSDEEVIEHLIPVRGIGRWTAQMFLIFCLGRLDVLPVGDFGLRAGVQKHYGLAELPKPDQLEELAEPWKPYRSAATWYFWRSLGPVPGS